MGIAPAIGAAASVAAAVNNIVSSGSSNTPQQVGSATQSTTNPLQQTQLPFLMNAWNSAQNAYNAQPTFSYYPGNTLADVTPQQIAGINAQTSQALAGSPVASAASNYASNVLNGDYLWLNL